MQEQLDYSTQELGIWKRILYMMVYAVLVGLVRMLIWITILIQTITVLFTGDINRHVLSFGRNLTSYLYHMLLFLTFNTDDLAFPFASWNLTKEVDLIKMRSKD